MFLAVCCGLLFAPGCDSSPSPVPVTLNLQYQGKPVEEVRVNLLNSTGGSAFAVTDAEGTATSFTTNAPGDGVVPGTYTVTLMPQDSTVAAEEISEANAYAVKPQKLPFPAKYRSISESGLQIDVDPQGENKFDLKLD